jgi:hypothetical protein
MKSLKELLKESKKTYKFKIGVAGELPEKFVDRLKTVLEKYELVSLSAGKKTPIQTRPLDFPQLQNTEVTYFDAELGYPTTPNVLQEYLGSACSVHVSRIVVRVPGEPIEEYQQAPNDDPYEPLLTTDYKASTADAQKLAGEDRVMDLLKELEIARKERNHEPSAAAAAE